MILVENIQKGRPSSKVRKPEKGCIMIHRAYNILTTHFVTILGSRECSVGVGKDSGR